MSSKRNSPDQDEQTAGSTPNLLTSPFDLIGRIQQPRFRVDVISFVDFAFIALLFLLLTQVFFFSPGVTIDLPEFSETYQTPVQPDAVATIWKGRIVTTEGVFPGTQMERSFRDLFQKTHRTDPVLLLLMEKKESVEKMALVMESARRAGFQRIQIASRTEPSPGILLDSERQILQP